MPTSDQNLYFKKNTPYLGWRLLNLVTGGILALSILGVVYLIYQNIYATLRDTNVIMALSSHLNLEVLNLDEYGKNSEIIAAKKITAEVPKNLRNIFVYGPTSTTAAYASSTR